MKDIEVGIRAAHDPDMLMFDVPPAFLSRGLECLHGNLGEHHSLPAESWETNEVVCGNGI